MFLMGSFIPEKYSIFNLNPVLSLVTVSKSPAHKWAEVTLPEKEGSALEQLIHAEFVPQREILILFCYIKFYSNIYLINY